jgi:galactoside O-acetyltransferase
MSYTDVEYKFKRIGENVQIGKNVYFRYPELVEIGNNVIIDEFCYFTTALIVEDFVHIAPLCSVIGGKESKLILREFSGLSAGCRVVCGSDDYLGEGLTNPTVPIKYRNKSKSTIVEIQKHAVIGTSTVVHPGIIIGEGAAIGSMSLVTKNLEPWGVYKGIPASKFKERNGENILKLEKLFKEDILKKKR